MLLRGKWFCVVLINFSIFNMSVFAGDSSNALNITRDVFEKMSAEERQMLFENAKQEIDILQKQIEDADHSISEATNVYKVKLSQVSLPSLAALLYVSISYLTVGVEYSDPNIPEMVHSYQAQPLRFIEDYKQLKWSESRLAEIKKIKSSTQAFDNIEQWRTFLQSLEMGYLADQESGVHFTVYIREIGGLEVIAKDSYKQDSLLLYINNYRVSNEVNVNAVTKLFVKSFAAATLGAGLSYFLYRYLAQPVGESIEITEQKRSELLNDLAHLKEKIKVLQEATQ